jgi:thioredoxin 1
MAHELSDATFKTEVLESGKVAIIDLWAEWCGPCKAMTPIVEELSAEYEGRVLVGKINVDDNLETPTVYGVRGIPTFLIFKDGELKERLVGTQSKGVLSAKIDALLT